MMRFLSDSKKILQLALPLLSSRLMNVIVFFTGFILIARLGPNEFAASSLASSIFVTLIMIGVGFIYAVGIKISHAFGADNYEKIRGYFYAGILLAILFGLLTTLSLIVLSFLLPYLGQKPSLIPQVKTFMYSLTLPLNSSLITTVCSQLVISLLRPRIIFISSILNVPFTIAILYWLIFGGLGIPPLGAWGLGLAFFISDIFQCAIILWYVATKDYFKQFNLWRFVDAKKHLLKRLMENIHLGFPIGIQFGAEVAAFSVMTFLIGRFGVEALNALQITNQIVVLALMVPFTISEASAILVGQALGRKNPADIRSYGFSSVKLGILILLLVSVFFYIMPETLMSIYINVKNPALKEIVELSRLFLYVAAIFQIFDGVRNIITGSLRGLHDSKYPMYIGIFVMWVICLPGGLLLAFYFNVGPVGFLIAENVAVLIGALILLFRFHHKSKPENIEYLH